MKNFTLIIILIWCTSCAVPKIDLSDEEKAYQDELRKHFQCNEIELRHDYYAISEDRKDGEFIVSLCNNICQRDSSYLSSKAIELTRDIRRFLSHSQNYSHLTLYTSMEKQIDERTSKLVCNKTIKVSLRDLKVVEFNN